jgi:ATP-binding cassette subfamily B protein
MFSVSKNLLAIVPYLWNKQNKNNKTLTVVACICVAVTIALNLSVPIIFKYIVNALSKYHHDNFKIALILLIAYGICWLSGRYLEKIREMIFFRPISCAITEHSLDVFNHIHAQSLKFHLDRETGKISSAIQKAQLAIAMMVTNLLFRICPVLIEVLLAFFILWGMVGVKISIILITTLVGYLVANHFVIKIFKHAEQIYQDMDVMVDKRLIDSLLNSENVKFLHAENHEIAIADRLLGHREDAIIKVFWTGTLATTVQAVVLGLGLIIISYCIAQDILNGTLVVGDFVLVNGYLLLLFNPLEAVSGFLRNTVSCSVIYPILLHCCKNHM